ncbi:hypothetical protein Btru_057605 [Bulinus truncatus]|nr:hypothetical protein Btru_057605 [Bulinus truncatus]
MCLRLVILAGLVASCSGMSETYQAARRRFIEEEIAMRVGAKLFLNPSERLVNKFLMDLKNDTIQRSIWTTTPYPPAISFFKSKAWIDNSTIFDIIKMMPKGGVLHLHDVAMTSLDWVIKTLTYLPHLYTRVEPGTYPTRRYKFSDSHPGQDWVSMTRLRSASNDPDQLDESRPVSCLHVRQRRMGKFNTYFKTMYDLISSKKIARMYLDQAFKEFYEDGVQYMEIKTTGMTDTDGNDVTDAYLDVIQSVIEDFQADHHDFIGAKVIMAGRSERLVNKFLMDLKNDTIQRSIWTTTPYPPAISFFKSKAWIDNSTIFDIIKMMPKGGVLHLHDVAMTSLDWVIKTLTYLPHLYTRVEPGTYPTRRYKFSDSHPGQDWVSMTRLRSASNDPDQLDESLKMNMSIWTEDPFLAYMSVNDVWGKFNTYFKTMYDLISSKKIARMYLDQAFKEFYEDGVQYMEIKTTGMTDTDGNDVTDAYLDVIQSVIEDFQADHHDFIGAKVIMAGRRSVTSQREIIDKSLRSMKKYPDLVKGFDLLQQEDTTHWTVAFIDDLLKNGQSNLPYFFHAGETDWTQWVDLNLVDSVLLNASRIGHGYAAYHHPKVMKAVMTKGIAIELNPISNQVLGLVNDLRNHPGAFLIANGAPVVISSDDPPVWMASPLSHDFYMTFMALGAVHDDLRLLKQLAMNSITRTGKTFKKK